MDTSRKAETSTPETKVGPRKGRTRRTTDVRANTGATPSAAPETAATAVTPEAAPETVAKVAMPEAAPETVAKAATPRDGTKQTTAAPVKLSTRQHEFLKKIHDAGAAGYEVGLKSEQRTIDALLTRQLVKRGTKNKETGKSRFLLTKAGEKQLPTAPTTAS